MDDDSKEYRRNKPQQKFYKPGSGPLRRSSYGLDAKMDTNDLDGGSKSRNQNYYGSQNSIADDLSDSYRGTSMRHKKPEQQLYVPRSGDSCSDNGRQSKVPMRCDNSSQYVNRRMSDNPDRQGSGSYSRSASKRDRSFADYHNKDGTNNDINYNRQYRQASETRSISPTHMQDQNSIDRNRDSRSMETSAGRHLSSSGGKPPSGRRNSSGYTSDSSRLKYMVNLDNIPPRFRKKFLEQSGHHNFDSDQIRRDKYSSNQSVQPVYNQDTPYYNMSNWSQTLPSRGRGRLRDNEGFDREKFISTYLKSYDVQNSRKSTPSSSYLNLYDTNSVENKQANDKVNTGPSSTESQEFHDASQNGTSSMANTISSSQPEHHKQETDNEHDSETTSQISATLLDISNLDWTEEVEKNIKLDDMGDSSTSFSQNLKKSVQDDVKPAEPRESKRSGRSRRKDRRSSSRGLRKESEKKVERNRKDSTASIQHEPERARKDSNVSIQHEIVHSGLKQRERERRDSHKSNRSSTIGNSRDDLDRWRSLRSYSREQSTEGRIVSQCNSRDTSANRATSPRDHDGFRIPSSMSKSAAWLSTNPKKSNGSWANGRTSSVERGRQSPASSHASVSTAPAPEGGSGRRSRKRAGRRTTENRERRRGRNAEAQQPQQQHSQSSQHAPSVTPAPAASHSHGSSSGTLNWREEILESKKMNSHEKHPETNSRNKAAVDSSSSHPGLIMLPQASITHMQKDLGRGGSVETQKTLFDHQNPSKPIIVQTSPSKIDIRMERGIKESSSRGNAGYEANDAARAVRHRALLQEVDRADVILQTHILRGPLGLADHWPDVTETRAFLQNALQRLLMSDLKYCQADNIEHHFWKILYYNFIEPLRKSFTQMTPEDKPKIVKLINVIIEEGNTFFENLIQMLEKTYKFNVDDYINDNHVLPPKGLGYVGLALISVQKIYVFLGDLARYKEQVNETNNYAKSKFWYTKAQQINPKNGRPYNQLAILAIYARRKLDAVYYYMRSLMSSNPFHSARESLLSLFDENRKKYEAAERKRRAALEATKNSDAAASGGTSNNSVVEGTPGMKREVWVRPSGHRTTTFRPASRDEQLATMTSVELNKNFITSYLHVHGKLITKIGMETFYESASLMLRQFRALLHRQPLPTPAARLLQLTALNMFAVETTAASLKEGNSGERSAWLECALGVSLLMFGAMLERCCALLPEAPQSQHHTDALLLLPAIKVWSDWMLCHSSIWNPPPSFDSFDVGADNDPWDWLAKLMNILEALDDKSIEFENEMKEGYVCVRLPEDASLGGFTPLMYMEPAVAWVRADQLGQHHAAEHALRITKLLFFGTEYLVGVEPPVLKLECPADASPRYVSAVQRAQPLHAPLQQLSENSEDESNTSGGASEAPSHSEGVEAEGTDETTRKLLRRKEQLETRKATIEKHRQRMQEILKGGSEIEVRPRWLVPDTNCFIDHLELLQAIVAAPAQPYTLAVPVVVMTELEGLRLSGRVGSAARSALSWVGGAGAALRLATSRGSLLATRACTAEAAPGPATNDDRVLATALSLHNNVAAAADNDSRGDDGREAPKVARRVREVVLLTDDRNLRVKALAAELPTRDLPSFVHWAGLIKDDAASTEAGAGAGEESAGARK
ncbi:telomerase-binding protein EST1A isoform X3 [Spodoptera litura]|uniref:Telomerase-binding protein EST1A isoform X3 n=1 Tax=Spodoptera litura TaxID=69820 RepID=A0A9J7E0X1_SPOLT|nr:telomerase-binding protein EST1A isoform X3 [Spodoptera litura]